MSDFQVGDKVVVVVDHPDDMGLFVGQAATVMGVDPEWETVDVEFIPEDGPQTDHNIYEFGFDEVEKVAP